MPRPRVPRSVHVPHVAVIAFTAVLAAAWLTACASNPGPILVKPPPEQPTMLIVGEVGAADPEARRWARFLRSALIDRLIRAEAFSVVYDRDGPSSDGNVLVLAGMLTEADRGSDVWRFVIGSGMGRPRLAGEFQLADSSGSVRAAFSIASDEDGPAGLTGHWAPVSMDAMASELGQAAADAIIRWRRGEEIAKATWTQQ